MDNTTRLRMRRAHTKHKGYCTCGKIVCGNGGLYNHREMHKRKNDGHYFMTYSAWLEQQKRQS
jgi:asparagine synthetase B (glutamine-hydrolysing)